MSNSTINYWIDISDYDLETAEAMLKTKRYLYVGFMAHQSVEKILKACYVKNKNETAPYIHNILLLAEKAGIINDFSEDRMELLEKLNPLNIEARYPSNKDEIFKSLNDNECEIILKQTSEFQQWVKKKYLI